MINRILNHLSSAWSEKSEDTKPLSPESKIAIGIILSLGGASLLGGGLGLGIVGCVTAGSSILAIGSGVTLVAIKRKTGDEPVQFSEEDSPTIVAVIESEDPWPQVNLDQLKFLQWPRHERREN